jgi:putative acetyltransferase
MIRKFQNSDMDQIINIWLDASIKSHDFVDSGFWESKIDDMRNIYIPSGETYIYEEDEMIKGFVSLYKNTVGALFVSPSFQGLGIGKKLIEKSKQISQQLDLTVYKENIKSIEFYKKNGFKIEKEQIDKHTGHIEIVMTFNS